MIIAGPRGAALVRVAAAMFPAVSAQQISSALFFGGLLLGFVANFGCLALCQSDPRVRCPYCRNQRINARLALATEHCEHCGRPVPFQRPLNEVPGPLRATTPDDPKLPSVDEFRLDVRKYSHYSIFVVALPTLAIFLASGWLVLGVLLYRSQATPTPRAANRAEAWLIVACIVSPPLLYAAAACARWQRLPLLTCRHCRRALISRRNVVIASRHCWRCQARVLRDGV